MAFNKDGYHAFIETQTEMNEAALEAKRIAEENKNKPFWQSAGESVMEAADTIGNLFSFVGDTASNINLGEIGENAVKSGMQNLEAYRNGEIDAGELEFDIQQDASEAAAKETAIEAGRVFVQRNEKEKGWFGDKARSMKRSAVGIEYLWNNEEKLARAREIEAETGINSESFLYDAEAYRAANDVYEYTKKMKELTPGKETFDIENVYKEFPGLKEIAGMDPQAAALALHDIRSIRQTHGVIDSFAKMLEYGNKKLEHDNLYYKRMNGEVTEAEIKRMEELDKELMNAPELPSFLDDPMANIAAGVASSSPEMLQSVLEGAKDAAVVGGAMAGIGALGGGVGAAPAGLAGAGYGFRYGMFMGMYRPEAGARYAENLNRKDTKGNRLLSDEEARYYAMLGGTLNAGIEMANIGTIKELVLGGKTGEAALKEIISRSTMKAAARQETKSFMRERAGVAFETILEESAEEGVQAVSDDLIHNSIADAKNTGDKMSVGEIIADGVESFVDAIPTSIGFGVGGGALGSPMAAIGRRRMNQVARQEAEMNASDRRTMVGTMMYEKLQAAVQESSLKDTSPETQRELLRKDLAGTGFETVYIDTQTALDKEGGLDDLKKVAKAAGMTSEDLETAIQEGNLMISGESFAQAESSPELLESVTFTPEAEPMARQKQRAKELVEKMEELKKQAGKQYMDFLIKTMKRLFPNDEEAWETAQYAMAADDEGNPAKGWKAYYKELTDQRDAILKPAIDTLKKGMGQGIDIISDSEGRGTRVSNNEKWYRDFYAQNKRPPRVEELRDMARAMVTGAADAPEVQGWRVTDAETAEALKENEAVLDELDKKINVMDRIKDRMLDLTPAEIGMVQALSPEGYETYLNVRAGLMNANMHTARTARFSAALLAFHAEEYAKKYTEKTGQPYTAMDYFRDKYALNVGGESLGGFSQQEVENQKEEVRKRYEGTDQWMKAPNGKPTKLTEDQWLTVRTEAFKEWFGDWENDPENASKVIDENGEPRVVYHGTGAEFDTFSHDYLGTASGDVGFFGKGFYFAFRKGEASMYNPTRVIDAFINLKNPFFFIEEMHIYDGMRTNVLGADNVAFVLNMAEKFPELTKNHVIDAWKLDENGEGEAEELSFAEFAKKVKDVINNKEFRVDEVENSSGEKEYILLADRVEKTFTDSKGKERKYVDYGFQQRFLNKEDAENKLLQAYYYLSKAVYDGIDIPSATTVVMESDFNNALLNRGYDGVIQSKVGDEVVAFEPNQIKAATGNNGNFDANDPNIYHQFAGENAKTADALKLSEAKSMEAEGASEEDIYKKTGWLKGKDGKWRFEIPDNLDKIDFSALEDEEAAYLKDIYDNPALYKAYPELAYVSVQVGNALEGWSEDTQGMATEGAIFLRRESLYNGKAKTTLIHELQHVIQKREGFAAGGNPRTVKEKIRKEIQKISQKLEMPGNDAARWEALQKKVEAIDDSDVEAWLGVLQELNDFEKTLPPEKAKQISSLYFARKELNEALKSFDEEGLYHNLGGEQEAEEAAFIATSKADAAREVENGETRLREAENRLSDAIKSLPDDQQKEVKGFIESRDYDNNDEMAAFDDYPDAVLDTMTDVMSAYDELQKALENKEKVSERMPSPHNANAIIVFNGNEMSYQLSVDEDRALQIENGKKAIRKCAETHEDVRDAMYRPDTGSIDFVWGEPGRGAKFKRGFGLAHILAKHKPESGKALLEKIVETIALGTETERQESDHEKGQTRLKIHYQGFTAVLSLATGQQNTWLLTGWEDGTSKKEAPVYAGGEGYDSTAATTDGPTLTRPAGGTGTSINSIIPQKGENLNQAQGQQNKGQTTTLRDGRHLISLFQSADESTYVHELAHLFLLDLEELAAFDEESKKMLETVKFWAEYTPGQVKAYESSPWYKEFKDRAQKIEAAIAAGDKLAEERLKREWAHERFARGFELYLRDGKAPTKGLKLVFRQFKNFLRKIYTMLIGDGVRPSDEVKQVMMRLIASDEEIEAAALDERWKPIEELGGEKLIDETEAETYARYQREATEEAQDKLRSLIMRDLKKAQQEERQKKIDAEEARMREELKNKPVYLAEATARAAGTKEVVLHWFNSIKEFEDELVHARPLEQNLERYMDQYIAELDKETIQTHMTEENITRAMEAPYYRRKMVSFELAALRRKEALMGKLTGRAKELFGSVEEALDGNELKKASDSLKKLKYTKKWTQAEMDIIDEAMKASNVDEMRDGLNRLQKEVESEKYNLNDVMEANNGIMKAVRQEIRTRMQHSPLFAVTNVYDAIKAERDTSHRLRNAIRGQNWAKAVEEQQNRFAAAVTVEEKKKLKEKAESLVKKVEKQLSTRSVRLPKNERYWHRHLAYILKITDTDAEKPEEGVISLDDLFKELRENLDVETTPTNILEKAQDESFQGWKSLTIEELQDAVDTLNVIYTAGKNKFKLKSIDGKLLKDVIDEIRKDDSIIRGGVNEHTIRDNTGGLGYLELYTQSPALKKLMESKAVTALIHGNQRALAATMKVEEILLLLGPKAHKYIYGIYERAANNEAEMLADINGKLEKIMSVYTRKELVDWDNQAYTFTAGNDTQRVTKREIFCMALNMGNEVNRSRLVMGLGIDEKQNPLYMSQFLAEHMTKKDWETVQKIWDLIDEMWPETVRVEEELNGRRLEKVAPRAFVTSAADTGERIEMRGGYYPIAYNAEKSSRSAELIANGELQLSMNGNMLLGIGRGFTKSRTEAVIERPLLLSTDVITQHIMRSVHNATFRIAARDIFRLVRSKDFEEHVNSLAGRPFYEAIKKWSEDGWTPAPSNGGPTENLANKALGYLRRNSVMAIMGYRIWPVIENVSNIGPTMDAIGAHETLQAVMNFYSDFGKNIALLKKSPMMRERINSMDRDIQREKDPFTRHSAAVETLKDHAYSLMTMSDLMLSAPLWVHSYQNHFAEILADVEKDNEKKKEEVLVAETELIERKKELSRLRRELYDMKDELMRRKYMSPEERARSPFNLMSEVELSDAAKKKEPAIKEASKAVWEAENRLEAAHSAHIWTDEEIAAEARLRAIERADKDVRSAFGSGRTIDQADIQRQRNQMMKLLTTFYSFFNTQFNGLAASYYRSKYQSGWRGMRKWAPFARSVMYRLVLVALIGSILKALTGTDGEDKRKKVKNDDGQMVEVEVPWTERFIRNFAKNLISTGAGQIVVVRDVVGFMTNKIFDGTDYGRGFNPFETVTRGFGELGKTFELLVKKGEKDLELEEKHAKERERYSKMNAEQRRRHNDEQRYKKPEKRITYSEAARHFGKGISTLTGAETGLTTTLVDAVTSTMMYLNDSENRYNHDWDAMLKAIVFDKNPEEREVPIKPVKPKKKNKGGTNK